MSAGKVWIEFEGFLILMNRFVELSCVGENITVGSIYDHRHRIEFESAMNLGEPFVIPFQRTKMLSKPLMPRCVVRIEFDGATILSLRSDKVIIVIIHDLTKRCVSFRELVVEGERLQRRFLCFRHYVARGLVCVDGEQRIRIGETGVGERVVWIFLDRSEEHTSELQSRLHLQRRLLLERK